MKKNLQFAIFLLVWSGWALWRTQHPAMLQLVTGRPDDQVIEFLRNRGAHYQVTEHGFRLADDSVGFECLYTLMRHESFALDLCSENLANAKTSRTADGTPYRRKYAIFRTDGYSSMAEDQSDFHWVYDPSNFNAQTEGIHAGYVAMPNVNVMQETMLRNQHRTRVANYARALRQLERLHHDLVVFDSPVYDQPVDFEPLPQSGVSFESLLNRLEDGHQGGK
ncbi:MAG: hypothetical protein U0931_42325 [Vulcanimicrobiota bacterium]